MKSCHIVSDWLDLMVDGNLEPADTAAAEEHLRSCPACRADLAGLRAVKRAAAELPRELTPSRDLWVGIQPRLATRKAPRPWHSPVVIAAAATVVAAIALAVLLAPSRSARPTAFDENPVSAAVRVRSEMPTIESYKVEFERARTDLLTVIEARRDKLDPNTLEVIDHNMQLIDQAIADIEKALAANPNEAYLDRQLKLAYQQQIDLLRWAARLSA